jgi:hypothetical protein
MKLEDRLFVVVRDAIGWEFPTFGALALRIVEQRPPEFSYNRLDARHVMRPRSIVPYISLAHLLGVITQNSDDNYECFLTQEPTRDGLDEVITQRAVECLEKAGFKQEVYIRSVHRMVRSASLTIPTSEEVYKALPIKVTESQFSQLVTLGGVRRHFGFTFITRRIMLPTGGNAT